MDDPAVGGAAGNTICVHNVVAASAVAGLAGNEGSVIRKTLPVFLYYAVIAGACGYAIVRYHETGIFSAGSLLLLIMIAALWWWIFQQTRRR